jgi:hypothetical protein
MADLMQETKVASKEHKGQLDELKQRISNLDETLSNLSAAQQKNGRPSDLLSRTFDVGAVTVTTAGIATPAAAEITGKKLSEEVVTSFLEVGLGSGLVLLARAVFELLKRSDDRSPSQSVSVTHRVFPLKDPNEIHREQSTPGPYSTPYRIYPLEDPNQSSREQRSPHQLPSRNVEPPTI